MKRHARTAFTALKAMGAPVLGADRDPNDMWGAHFILSAEDNYPVTWADYYREGGWEREDPETGEILNAGGIKTEVNRVLAANGLYAEWIDPGTVGIYDA